VHESGKHQGNQYVTLLTLNGKRNEFKQLPTFMHQRPKDKSVELQLERLARKLSRSLKMRS